MDEGSHDRELSIALGKEGDFTVGELRLIERDGTLRQRSVRFTTCAEAVEGLALITTVSLDPQALLEVPTEAEPTAMKPALPQRPKREPPESTPPTRTSEPKPPPLLARGAEANIGLEANAYFNAVPKTALGGTLFLDEEWGSGHVFAPLFRVSVSHVERWSVVEQGGEANFALTLAKFAGCPIRIGAGAVAFRPCAFFGGGPLRAWGAGLPDSPSRTRPYWSWGGSAMLLVRVSEVMEIVGDADVGAALIRDSFAFAGQPFWRTPSLYVSSGLGVRLLLR